VANINDLKERDYLAYRWSFAEKFAAYHPKHVAALGLTGMVTVLAQMRNLRRGHDTQGRVKRVNIDAAYENYANYMAPMRMTEIELEVKAQIHAVEANSSMSSEEKQKEITRLRRVFNRKTALKPATDTFLTSEWDEMIPFPTSKYHLPRHLISLSLLRADVVFYPQPGSSALTASVSRIMARSFPSWYRASSRMTFRHGTSLRVSAVPEARLPRVIRPRRPSADPARTTRTQQMDALSRHRQWMEMESRTEVMSTAVITGEKKKKVEKFSN
jgi:hypothetical protein